MDVTPAHHIGILNFGLPHVQKQFYGHYYMTNKTTHDGGGVKREAPAGVGGGA
ncbi:MAG: hypothetical protein NC254_03605 [bacterium]|nr:hypothetical protein [bacterium]